MQVRESWFNSLYVYFSVAPCNSPGKARVQASKIELGGLPVTSSYAFYHTLKDNGVTVKFFAFPIAGQEPGDPVHDSDKDRVWIE